MKCFEEVFGLTRFCSSVSVLKSIGSQQKKGKRKVPMYCFGSTNFACNTPRLLLKDGRRLMIPRPYAKFKPSHPFFNKFAKDDIGMGDLILYLENLCINYFNDLKNTEDWADSALQDMLDSREVVPKCCRIYNTAFTFLSLNGDLNDNVEGIGKHVDINDSFNVILHVGNCSVGGGTLYYMGKESNTVFEMIAFNNGNLQVGQYSAIYHGTQGWTGQRCSIALSVKRTIVDYFRTYGSLHYNKYIVADNYACPNVCIEFNG